MKLTTSIPALAVLASVSAHDAPNLSGADVKRLHKARSVCERDLHCVLNREVMEGPFYIPDPLIRSNITEDRLGQPLNLQVTVVDVTKCEVASDVWVDIWHTDGDGVYSGWADDEHLNASPDQWSNLLARHKDNHKEVAQDEPDHDGPPHDGPPFDGPPHDGPPHDGPPHRGPPHGGPPGGGHGGPGGGGGPPHHTPVESSRWLRGVAKTDKHGIATFDSVMPAWYFGRTTHIHIRMHTGNTTIENGMLVGEGTVAHTGQLFFPDEIVLELAETAEPYKSHAKTLKPKLNGDDGLYVHEHGEEQLITVEKESGVYVGKVIVGIDPTVDHPEGHHDGDHEHDWEHDEAHELEDEEKDGKKDDKKHDHKHDHKHGHKHGEQPAWYKAVAAALGVSAAAVTAFVVVRLYTRRTGYIALPMNEH